MLTVHSTLKKPPRLKLEPIITEVLGKTYNLSLTFVGPQRAQTLNQRYRNKTYVPNVLSFPLTTTDGEIYLCPAAAKKEAPAFAMREQAYLTYLVLHGALHLKGFHHGAAMDAEEARLIKKYQLQ